MSIDEVRLRLDEVSDLLKSSRKAGLPRSVVAAAVDRQLDAWQTVANDVALSDLRAIQRGRTVRMLDRSDVPVGALLVAVVGTPAVRKWMSSLIDHLPEPPEVDVSALEQEHRSLLEIEAELMLGTSR